MSLSLGNALQGPNSQGEDEELVRSEKASEKRTGGKTVRESRSTRDTHLSPTHSQVD